MGQKKIAPPSAKPCSAVPLAGKGFRMQPSEGLDAGLGLLLLVPLAGGRVHEVWVLM